MPVMLGSAGIELGEDARVQSVSVSCSFRVKGQVIPAGFADPVPQNIPVGLQHPAAATWPARRRWGRRRSPRTRNRSTGRFDSGRSGNRASSQRRARRLTGPLRQEMPLHLQLADLLVQSGNQGGIVPGPLVRAVAEDDGGALGECFLPGPYPGRVDFIPSSQLGHRFLPLQCLMSHLGIESWAVIPASLRHFLLPPSATAALSLGVGL